MVKKKRSKLKKYFPTIDKLISKLRIPRVIYRIGGFLSLTYAIGVPAFDVLDRLANDAGNYFGLYKIDKSGGKVSKGLAISRAVTLFVFAVALYTLLAIAFSFYYWAIT